MYTKIYYEKLYLLLENEQQKKAFLSNEPVIVLAGPGSGKTAVLTLKATKALECQAKPYGVACITYSNEAVAEMKQRLNSYGLSDEKRLFIGTIHHFCISEVLNAYAENFKIELPFPLKIANSEDRKIAFSKAKEKVNESKEVKELDMNVERRNRAGALSTIIAPSYDLALKVAIEYEKELRLRKVIDFEDIVNYSVKLIQDEEYVRKAITSKYKWIFVDEYQDLGKPLHEIILSLLYNTNVKLFIVGDPDQSIYSFTGANPNYMKELIGTGKFMPVQLVHNYRSPQEIVNASAIVLGQDKNYIGIKKEKAEFIFHECNNGWYDQFELLAKKVIADCDKEAIPREEIGVLIKGHKEIAMCKRIFEKNGIDCYISKREFEKTTLINWIGKCAQWFENSASISIIAIFNEWCRKFNLDKSFDFYKSNSIIKFSHILKKCDKSTLANWVNDIINFLNIENNITEDEKENLQTFKTSIESEEFQNYSVSMFSKIGKPINQVVLLTWYAAKGLEFDSIILTGMDEGIFPDYKTLKDEQKSLEQRRMCFVGVSRARKKCILTRASRYTAYSEKYDKFFTHDYRPSRFWNELKELIKND